MKEQFAQFANVDQVIAILQKASDAGMGGYVVSCNLEYWLARPDDEPDVNDEAEILALGGYL